MLLWVLLPEGRIHLILFDTPRWVAALIKALLFGAIAHHAGMRNARLLFGILTSGGFIHHIKYSCAIAR